MARMALQGDYLCSRSKPRMDTTMNSQNQKRRVVLQTGIDSRGTNVVRVEGFVATGIRWSRCIDRKCIGDYVAGNYVESTYVPEQDWKTMQRDNMTVFMRERD